MVNKDNVATRIRTLLQYGNGRRGVTAQYHTNQHNHMGSRLLKEAAKVRYKPHQRTQDPEHQDGEKDGKTDPTADENYPEQKQNEGSADQQNTPHPPKEPPIRDSYNSRRQATLPIGQQELEPTRKQRCIKEPRQGGDCAEQNKLHRQNEEQANPAPEETRRMRLSQSTRMRRKERKQSKTWPRIDNKWTDETPWGSKKS